MISVKISGAKEFKRAARRAKSMLREETVRAAKLCAQQTAEWMRTSILSGSLNLQPVSEEWARRKEDSNSPPLVNTGAYVDSIVVRPVGRVGYRVDVRSVEMRTLAERLEFGTTQMVPRPHWRPAHDHARKVIVPAAGNNSLNVIAKELKR
jgi:hypothetical protein